MAVEANLHPAAFPCESCDCTNGIAPELRWKLKGQSPTDICFRQAATPLSRFLLSLVPHYQNGHMYTLGGVEQQPAIYLQAMMFLTGYVRDNKD